MSYESPQSSDAEWDEWELVHFQTQSTTQEIKSKKAKEKDVEKLAKEIREQLSVSQKEEKAKLEELNRKLNEQRQISEAKLQQIAAQLQSIVQLQQMTHNNHQETNAKLQEANDKLRQIENETKKQTVTNVPLLSYPPTATSVIPSFSPLPTLSALQQPITSPLQPTMTNFGNGESYPFHVNNNNYNNNNTNMFNNSISNNINNIPNTTSSQSNINNSTSFFVPTTLPLINNDQINTANNLNTNNNINNVSITKNTNNNSENNNNTGNTNNRPSALTSVFNFLLGNTNNQENNDNDRTDSNDENTINEEKHNTLEEAGYWECSNCYAKNEEASKFCPTCGIQNPAFLKDGRNNITKNDNTNKNNISNNDNNNNNNNKSENVKLDVNDLKLKYKNFVGETIYEPNEKKQCGWILTNNTKSKLKMKGSLQQIGGDETIKVTTEKCYEFELLSNDEVYLLFDVVAPNIVGKYCSFYQFVAQDGTLASDILELVVEVKSQFPKNKEDMIQNIIKMGFTDRNKVIYVLQKSGWSLQQAVDSLLTN